MRPWPALGLAVLVALAVPASAFPIGSQDYSAVEPFATGVEGITQATFLSGEAEAAIQDAPGPFVAFNVSGYQITGLTKVCWVGTLPECVEHAGGALRLQVADGGSVGLQFPSPVDATLASRHSIAVFVDIGQTMDFSGYEVRLEREMAAVHVDGKVALSGLPRLDATLIQDMAASNAAGLVLLDAGTRLQVLGGSAPRSLSGEAFAVTFQGKPAMAPFGAAATLLPFRTGSTAHFEPAEADAAQEGVDLGRVQRLVNDLQGALGEQQTESRAPDEAVQQLQPLLGAVLGGALMTLPGPVETPTALLTNVTLLRFDTLDATAADEGVELSGSGPLQIQGGTVVGAPGLVGLMPWWCWVLWLAALGLWVARLVVKPSKENEQWDRLRWVGWVAAPLTFLVVFWLWDGQVHKVWGLSLLRGGGGSPGTMLAFVSEVLIGVMVYLAVVLPLSSLLKSGARFAKQGRFMGLNRPVALVLGFLLGTTLLLSYLDLLLHIV